jgi:hypothetical protein
LVESSGKRHQVGRQAGQGFLIFRQRVPSQSKHSRRLSGENAGHGRGLSKSAAARADRRSIRLSPRRLAAIRASGRCRLAWRRSRSARACSAI